MKIAVCIPLYGDAKGPFAICLARMLVHTLATTAPSGERFEIEVFTETSTDLVANRTALLKRAIEWQARYVLWLDADHVFPPDALLRLIGHGLGVVGCNYLRRHEPLRPVTARQGADGEWEYVWTTADLADRGVVEEVAHVGLGLCLIDLNVLHQVKARVEEGVGWAHWEPFERRLVPGTQMRMSEDVSFFHELRDAGVAVHVDHRLSWETGHIAERTMTFAMVEKPAS